MATSKVPLNGNLNAAHDVMPARESRPDQKQQLRRLAGALGRPRAQQGLQAPPLERDGMVLPVLDAVGVAVDLEAGVLPGAPLGVSLGGPRELPPGLHSRQRSSICNIAVQPHKEHNWRKGGMDRITSKYLIRVSRRTSVIDIGLAPYGGRFYTGGPIQCGAPACVVHLLTVCCSAARPWMHWILLWSTPGASVC